MKSLQQAKIWRNKVQWWNDAHLAEVTLRMYENRNIGNKPTERKILAIVKDGLALHLEFAPEWFDSMFLDGFSVSHLASGMNVCNLSKNKLYDFDFEQVAQKAELAWSQYTPELKEKLGVNTPDLNTELEFI